MGKKVHYALVLLWVSVWMTFMGGCASKEECQIDIEKLAQRLSSEISYEDHVTLSTEEMALLLYNLQADQIKEAYLYLSAGATTEEIAVFECSDEKTAITVKKAAEQRIQQQKESVKTYNPKELQRLEQALVQTEGPYVIVSISGDPELAQQIVNEVMER
ncbi:MAG: DUF4358 domain-containing protein [Lachnospiraceae bacterium]|jgi:hypothetical protein|nr:DUF4358 domain-containing protein [Lachnospiraceae bacterium]